MTTQIDTNGSSTNGDGPLLEVKNLKMYFPVTSGIIFQRKVADVKAVDDVTFTINQGETFFTYRPSLKPFSFILRKAGWVT